MRFGKDMYWHLTSILPIAYVMSLTWYMTAAGLHLAMTSRETEPLFIRVQSHSSRISLVLPEKMWIGRRWSEALNWLWHHIAWESLRVAVRNSTSGNSCASCLMICNCIGHIRWTSCSLEPGSTATCKRPESLQRPMNLESNGVLAMASKNGWPTYVVFTPRASNHSFSKGKLQKTRST